MSLERPDIKFRLNPDTKTKLDAIADARGMTLAEWVERVVEREIAREVHEATVLVERLSRTRGSGK